MTIDGVFSIRGNRGRGWVVTLALVALLGSEAKANANPVDALEFPVVEQQTRRGALPNPRQDLDSSTNLTPASSSNAGSFVLSETGLTLTSTDGRSALWLHGYMQFDSRVFLSERGEIVDTEILVRRERLVAEGMFATRYGFQFTADFAARNVNIVDASANADLADQFHLKVGKFKSPIGLELLQPITRTFFNERSLATGLVPTREVGAQVAGRILDRRVHYAFGVFNGAADGASRTTVNLGGNENIVGRVMLAPFPGPTNSLWQGLNVGIAACQGHAATRSGRTNGYRTAGRRTFFGYLNSVVGDGPTGRISPQLDYRCGRLGVLAEYVRSTVTVTESVSGKKAGLTNCGWQISTGYVLTGESSSYAGVVPRAFFNPSAGTWGAFEIVARCGALTVDGEAFPVFASPAANAKAATSVGLGCNWILTKAMTFKCSFDRTRFGFSHLAPTGSSAAARPHDEQVIISRFQIAF